MKQSSINITLGSQSPLLIARLFACDDAGGAAEDSVTVNISLKDHRFQPAELHAPAGKPITIIVKNLDPAPAEFESNMLRVEKVVTGGGTITLRIRPLEPGRYRFFDDFHQETQGYLVVQ